MIKVNNKTVSSMYFQKGGTSADASLPVEIIRAYYNTKLVFGEMQPEPELTIWDTDTTSHVILEYYIPDSNSYRLINQLNNAFIENFKVDGVATSKTSNYFDKSFETTGLHYITFNIKSSISQYTWINGFKDVTVLKRMRVQNKTGFNIISCNSMFSGCTNLEYVDLKCLGHVSYSQGDQQFPSMFYGCAKLRKIKMMETYYSYGNHKDHMFDGCTSLETICLPSKSLSDTCYNNRSSETYFMYPKLSSVKSLILSAEDTGANIELYDYSNITNFATTPYSYFNHISPAEMIDPTTKTYVRTIQPNSSFNIRSNEQSISIEIIDVFKYKLNGSDTWVEKEEKTSYILDNLGTNESETETRTINRTISHRGQTYNITIIQGVKVQYTVTWDLNDGDWEQFTPTDGDNDAAYYFRSIKHKGQNSTFDKMTIRFSGDIPGGFWIGIRSYAESNYDYTIASKIDNDITSNIDYNNSKVKLHTRGKQVSGNASSNYTLVDYSTDYNDTDEHFVTVIYRKDGSQNANDDRGYVLIPKEYEVSEASVVNDEPLESANAIDALDLSADYLQNSYISNKSYF